MNIVSYNVRGLGRGVKWAAIRRLIKKEGDFGVPEDLQPEHAGEEAAVGGAGAELCRKKRKRGKAAAAAAGGGGGEQCAVGVGEGW